MNNVYNSPTVIREPHCQNRDGAAGRDSGLQGEGKEMHIPAQCCLKTVSYSQLEDEQVGSSHNPRERSQQAYMGFSNIAIPHPESPTYQSVDVDVQIVMDQVVHFGIAVIVQWGLGLGRDKGFNRVSLESLSWGTSPPNKFCLEMRLSLALVDALRS